MAKKLVIVESPAKAKTINKYLGSDFIVKASMGHIRDLPEKGLGVDIENKFEPTYEVTKTRAKLVSELKAAAKSADQVYLCPDPDREGEAIAWHLSELLGGRKNPNFFRVTFNEITKDAVRAAFQHAGHIDMNRVDSQQARRILDRIVGYQISPLLWKKLRGARSAGRVQSVAVRLIVEREREIRAFQKQEYWSVDAALRKPVTRLPAPVLKKFSKSNEEEAAEKQPLPADSFLAKLHKIEGEKFWIGSEPLADAILDELQTAEWVVAKLDQQARKRYAAPPFITSTLQQSASSALRMSPDQTMRVAQQLYEGMEVGEEGAVGLITYMRTDSVNVSREAQADTLKFIVEQFGREYAPEKPNFYRSKGGAQEAHEAIRPTSVRRTPESVARYLDDRQLAVYKLIWRRFVASQMSPSEMLVKSVEINAHAARKHDLTALGGTIHPDDAEKKLPVIDSPFRDYTFRISGTEITFPGFLKVYGVEEGDEDKRADDEGNQRVPALTLNEKVNLCDLRPEQHFTIPPPRYSEATLIKALEELGIGRPSTYAPTMKTIIDRKYVEKEKSKLKPTDIGEQANDLLVKTFPNLLDVQFTAQMEEQLDEVEAGKVEWHELLQKFYDDFKPMLDAALEQKKTPTGLKCPECKKGKLDITEGRRGEYLTCSKYPKCKFSSDFLRENGEIQIVEAEQTGVVCEKCGAEMVLRMGKQGEFLACSKYPKCKTAMNFMRDEAQKIVPQRAVDTGVVCKKCGKPMGIKSGRNGEFLACSGYPDCKSTMNFTRDEQGNYKPDLGAETGVTCAKCSSPMVIKRGRRGEFLACSGYPECRNAMPFERGPDGKIIPKPKAEIVLPEVVAQFVAAAKCDKCGKPMALKQSFGRFFLACTGYPKCKSSGKFPPDIAEALKAVTPKREPKAAPVLTEHKCDKCGSPMAIRTSARGKFLGCSAYPKCKNAQPLPGDPHTTKPTAPKAEATGEKCEKCGKPMVKRHGKFGDFLGCSGYPKCKNLKKIEPAA
jgi:DNA topoisomerase-1